MTSTKTRRSLATLAALAATAGAATVAATPADAAAGYGTATVCFRHTNGSPYTYDIYSQYWNGSSWSNFASNRSVNGCLTTNITLPSTGAYIKFQALYRVNGARGAWIGNSNWSAMYNGNNINFGTNTVGYQA